MAENNTNDRIITSSLEDVLHNSMIPYAEYVILDRALPRVEDGLKPVQRRILYSMYEQGFTPDKGYKKSAKVVGDCLAKYHPHGDISVYDAMVRMAQPFNMRMTLVDGHGNFGSVDGDGAAAMRYTEVRLQPLALELLQDLDKETVKFGLNFDDSLKEPETLPGRFPNLLVNGTYGIAVGLATNIPTHNLGEVIDGVVQYINNPKITLAEMMKYIKGPDFPTGGYIIAGQELVNAYETGKGKIIMRAKVTIEPDGEKKNIVIHEIPYQVNKAALLKKIADLKDEKKDELAGIADIVDESDRKGMRAVIKVKKDFDAESILAFLYKYTQLQCSFNINMVAIANGKPQQLSLLQIISYYVEYQRDVIVRRTRFDLNRAKERAHVLEGLIIAIQNIDEVIRIIKTAANTTEAKQTLKSTFELSDIQAQAILDLRLARLTKLEVYKLEEELKQLKALIEKLQAILDSKKLQMNVVKDEITAIKRKYKEERKSVIVSQEDSKGPSPESYKKPVENLVMVYTAAGNIKKVPKKNYDMSDKSVDGSSSLNDIPLLTLPVTSDMYVYAFTNKGNCVRFDLENTPTGKYREKGTPFKELFDECAKDEKPVHMFAVGETMPEGDILFFTKQGMVKRTAWADYNVQKRFFQAAKLKDGDEIISVENEKECTTVLFVTKNGLCLNAMKDDIPTQGRISGGVKGIALTDDEVIFAGQVDEEAEGEIIVVTSYGSFKRVIISGALEPMGRGRKGVKIVDVGGGSERVVYSGYVTEPFDLLVKEKDDNMYIVNTEKIEIDSRTSRGKFIAKHKKTSPVECFEIK